MPSIDAGAFREFEYRGWEASVAAYDRFFGRLTSQAIEPLLDETQVRQETRVLDVASGPGYVSAAAARRGASVVGVDFSERMVARSQELNPDLEFRHGDAESLPFGAATFDAVVMNFGVLHLGQPERAFAEASRVLAADGTFGFTVWCQPDEAVGFAIVLRAIEQYGDAGVTLPAGPPFFRFSSESECRSALSGAGLTLCAMRKLPLVWRLESADELFHAFLDGTARTGGLLRVQTPTALSAIKEGVARGCEPYLTADGLSVPMPAFVVSAVHSA